MQVRLAEAAEFSSILEILKYLKTGAEFNWNEASLLAELQAAKTLIIKIENQCAAFLTFRENVDFIDISVLATNPAWARQGLQTKLLQSLAGSAAKKNLPIFLEVHAENKTAIQLYEKNNFARVSVRKKYYSDGGDAIVLKWPIVGS